MKRITLFVAVLALAVAGCSRQPVSIVKYVVPCATLPVGDSFERLATMVRSNGMILKESDMEKGILSAGRMSEEKFWTFKVTDNFIEAVAHEIYRIYYPPSGFGEFGSTHRITRYFDDTTQADQHWFWNVRKGLDSVCDAKAVRVIAWE